MDNSRTIWKNERRQTDKITRMLVEDKRVVFGWRLLVPPLIGLEYFRYWKNCRTIRKNLLYTKQLAFEAAKNITRGEEHAWEIRRIEIRTAEMLKRDVKGVYTEKIRRKQLAEIELLLTHYLALFNAESSDYSTLLKATYPKKGKYLGFVNSLQQTEDEVIKAAISTTRTGTKKERSQWFAKIKATARIVRLEEADRIYS